MAEPNDTTTPPDKPQKAVLFNGVKLASEALVAPGTSLALNGHVAAGLGHLGGAHVAKALLGPVGWLLVAANSYSLATNGNCLLSEVRSARGRRKAAK
jgi:hypothetical protein